MLLRSLALILAIPSPVLCLAQEAPDRAEVESFVIDSVKNPAYPAFLRERQFARWGPGLLPIVEEILRETDDPRLLRGICEGLEGLSPLTALEMLLRVDEHRRHGGEGRGTTLGSELGRYIERLGDALRDRQDLLAKRALDGVRDILFRGLQSDDFEHRTLCCRLLGRLNHRPLARWLLDATRSRTHPVELEVLVGAIGELRVAEAEPFLLELLDGPNSATAAARALGQLGSETAVEALVKGLRSARRDHEAERFIEGLGETGSPEAARVLLAELDRREGHLRGRILAALGGIGGQEVAGLLLEKLRSDDFHVAVGAHAGALRLRPEGLLPRLVELVRTGSRSQRERAIRTLADLEEPDAAPYLVELLRKPRGPARRLAMSGLARLPYERVFPLLREGHEERSLDGTVVAPTLAPFFRRREPTTEALLLVRESLPEESSARADFLEALLPFMTDPLFALEAWRFFDRLPEATAYWKKAAAAVRFGGAWEEIMARRAADLDLLESFSRLRHAPSAQELRGTWRTVRASSSIVSPERRDTAPPSYVIDEEKISLEVSLPDGTSTRMKHTMYEYRNGRLTLHDESNSSVDVRLEGDRLWLRFLRSRSGGPAVRVLERRSESRLKTRRRSRRVKTPR